MTEPAFFVTGGTLRQDAQSYVARAADLELLELLKQGEFCYVLTSRQMGKSSLMVRTAAQLRENGAAVVVLDLTRIGQNLEVEQWYFSMLTHVGEQVHLEDELEKYWDAHERDAPLQRFMGALREVYLDRQLKPLVIFVDEIDYVRSLQKFSADEFFAGIRECYNRRPRDPKMARLTFCLLGVATPSDLIRDQRMTPFNIGRGIELHDFNGGEAAVLADGLSPHRETADSLLERILEWSSGHPYLTQRLCAEVVKAGVHTASTVDQTCEKVFLSAQARERDDNLHFVRERMLHSELDRAALLDVYAKVCRGERVADDHLSPIMGELRLSGIVRVVDGFLTVRNRIYARVFDLKWARANLPDAERRRQREAFHRGVRRVAGVSVAVLAVFGVLVFVAMSALDRERSATQTARRALEGERAAAQTARRALEGERAAAQAAQEAADRAQQAAQAAQASALSEAKAADRAQQAAQAAQASALREAEAADRAQRAAQAAEASALRAAEANRGRLEEAEKTKAALSEREAALKASKAALAMLSYTQRSSERLLEMLTPFVGERSDALLKLAEDLAQGLSTDASLDAKIRIGQAGLHAVCSKLYTRLGKNEKALALALEARRIAEELLHTDGQSDELKSRLFDFHQVVGDALLGRRITEAVRGKTEEEQARILEPYEAALRLARDETAAAPQNIEWRTRHLAVLANLGDTLTLFGRRDDADQRYAEAEEFIASLQARNPDDRSLKQALAALKDRRGNLYLVNGLIDKALVQFEASFKIRKGDLGEALPEDFEVQSDLATSYNKLGNVFLAKEQWQEALKYQQLSLQIRDALCRQAPTPDRWRHLGYSLNNVGKVYWNLHNDETAAVHFRRRIEITKRLIDEDFSEQNLRDYSNALYAYADLLLNTTQPSMRDWPRALELAAKAVEVTNRKDARYLALLAQAQRLSKLPVEARESAEQAAMVLPPVGQRSYEERQVAKDIDFELQKTKAASRPGAKPPAAATPTKRRKSGGA